MSPSIPSYKRRTPRGCLTTCSPDGGLPAGERIIHHHMPVFIVTGASADNKETHARLRSSSSSIGRIMPPGINSTQMPPRRQNHPKKKKNGGERGEMPSHHSAELGPSKLQTLRRG
jgi:hypothetical protein